MDGPKKKRKRGSVVLNAEQRLRLWGWLRENRQEALAELEISLTAARRYVNRNPVDWEIYKHIREKLSAWSALRNFPPGERNARDWLTRLNALYEQGRKLHFDSYQPEEAVETLSRFVHHAAISVMPLDDMLEKIAVVMAIYRQNSFTGVSNYAACANQCLRRLESTDLSNGGDALAARIGLIAFELASAAIQRGYPEKGMQILDEVKRVLDQYCLWDALPLGRQRTFQRMRHWGLVVAPREVSGVLRELPQRGTWLDTQDLGEFHDFTAAAERANTDIHRVAEHLRLAGLGRPGALEEAMELFSEKLHGPLSDFTHKRGRLRETSGATPLTPPAVMGGAFQALILGGEHGHRTDELLDLAINAADRLKQYGKGSVLLCHTNPQMISAFNRVAAKRLIGQKAKELFQFVQPLHPAGAPLLLDRARELIAMVERCYPKPVQGR